MSDTSAAAPADRQRWHVEKGIPIALIATLIAQTGAAVWWAGAMSNRVAVLESKAAKADIMQIELAGLKARVESIDNSTRRIEGKLDRLVERDGR